ncbi:MAG TPA: energy transducer TonB [Longimicrobiales bacterium]|nr:energy transducer TonB [Longimicrobiales bacterium]
MNQDRLLRTVVIAATAASAVLLSWGCAGDGEIEQPAPLYGEVPIDYPLQLWDQDMEGETLLRVRVTDTGQVDSVEVMDSSGHAAFDSAAVSGAKELRFRPARRGGKRIEVWAQVPVHFSKRPRPDTVGTAL